MATTELLERARYFSQKHPQARFAILRLWSAPHFYPLMLGGDNRYHTSFVDLTGRSFEWKFIPKDMPHSEMSMERIALQRIEPFEDKIGRNVVVKRDLYLVMGADEAELKKMAVATTFVVQTAPWRLEVDLWRSFINVNMEFLDNLDIAWLD